MSEDRKKYLKNEFCKWLTRITNEATNDFHQIDGFVIDNELTEEEIRYIQNIKLKVIPEGDDCYN